MQNEVQISIKSKREVNYQFRILYAMLMFCVLAGHIGSVPEYVPWVELFSAYGFGIQLFLFISGYFYSKKNDSIPHKFILKKVLTILLPYLGWNLFYGLVCLLLSLFGFEFAHEINIRAITIDAILHGPRFGFIGPLWFLVPFFFAEVFCSLERFAFSKFESVFKDIIILVINLGINFASIYYARHHYNSSGYYEGNLICILQAMFMLPYFTLGYIYKTYLEKKDTLSNTKYFLLLILLAVFYIFVNGHSSSYFVAVMGGYENVLFPTVTAFLGIAFYLRIARVITPVLGKSKVVNAIGSNTFAILIHHSFSYFVLSMFFVFCAKILPFLPDPDMERLFTDASYRYMPRGRGFPIVFIIFGFAYSIGFKMLVDLIKTKILLGINKIKAR